MDVERGDREGARRRKPKTSASEPERLPTTELSKDDGKKIFAVATDAEIAESAATVERVLRLVFALGAVSCFALGVWFVFSSNYVPPPVPLAHLLANVLVLPGAGLMLASTATLCSQLCTAKCTCQRAHGATVIRALFLFAWGGSLGAFGVLRFWLDHPYTLGKCPCPAFHADVDGVCVSCPGWEEGVCEDEDCVCGRGVCSETTATCFCDPNWATAEANGTCAQCSDRAMDGEPGGACGRCSARFKSDSRGDCTLCRNGYTGPDCMVCGPNFAPRTDDEGVVILDPQTGAEICSPVRGCKDDGQPSDGGRVGTMCEAVPEHKRCGKHGDQGAKIKYTNNNLQTPFSFTTTGVQCFYNYECPSYNCKGVCGFSSPIAGALCQEDADCLSGEVGVCGSRTCGAEWLVGEDDCQCSRSGYLVSVVPTFVFLWCPLFTHSCSLLASPFVLFFACRHHGANAAPGLTACGKCVVCGSCACCRWRLTVSFVCACVAGALRCAAGEAPVPPSTWTRGSGI